MASASTPTSSPTTPAPTDTEARVEEELTETSLIIMSELTWDEYEEQVEDEIDKLTAQFTDFNKHDSALCGQLHNAKLRSHGILIDKEQIVGNRVYNDMLTENHHKKETGDRIKDKDGGKGGRGKKGGKGKQAKPPKYESKPRYKDKRR